MLDLSSNITKIIIIRNNAASTATPSPTEKKCHIQI